MHATSGTGSEVARMSKEQMTNEKLYQATMSNGQADACGGAYHRGRVPSD